jgi:hypothetical protein
VAARGHISGKLLNETSHDLDMATDRGQYEGGRTVGIQRQTGQCLAALTTDAPDMTVELKESVAEAGCWGELVSTRGWRTVQGHAKRCGSVLSVA